MSQRFMRRFRQYMVVQAFLRVLCFLEIEMLRSVVLAG